MYSVQHSGLFWVPSAWPVEGIRDLGDDEDWIIEVSIQPWAPLASYLFELSLLCLAEAKWLPACLDALPSWP